MSTNVSENSPFLLQARTLQRPWETEQRAILLPPGVLAAHHPQHPVLLRNSLEGDTALSSCQEQTLDLGTLCAKQDFFFWSQPGAPCL